MQISFLYLYYGNVYVKPSTMTVRHIYGGDGDHNIKCLCTFLSHENQIFHFSVYVSKSRIVYFNEGCNVSFLCFYYDYIL